MTTRGFETTTSDVIAGLDFSGNTVLITGASAGLGVETARALAGAGANVVMLGRDPARLEAAAALLATELPSAQLDTALLDLASADSVRSSAATLQNLYPRVDVLINNAGVMACPLGRTAQGFELQFGTNHLGHFLFTNLMMPSLLAAAADSEARIVNLSSAAHRFGAVNLEDPNYLERQYDKWLAYGESKSANVLFSVALDARLRGQGIGAFAVHPGAIVTELGRHLEPADVAAMAAHTRGRQLQYKSVPQGAATSVWAATATELAGRGGIYLEDCQVATAAEAGGNGGVEAYAVDSATAERLWYLSEQLLGQEFQY